MVFFFFLLLAFFILPGEETRTYPSALAAALAAALATGRRGLVFVVDEEFLFVEAPRVEVGALWPFKDRIVCLRLSISAES